MGDIFRESDTKTSRFETAMCAAKLVFLSAGIISTFMFFKVAIIPYIFNFVFSVISSFPCFWISLRSWLSPPYIYLVLNVIIITIAASSTFHRQDSRQSDEHENRGNGTVIVTVRSKDSKTQKKKRNVNSNNNENTQTEGFQLKAADNGGRERESEWNPSEETSFKDSSMEDSGETPEKPKELVSLEETWKLITEGQGKEQKPRLKKSDTFDTPPRKATLLETGSDDGDAEDDSGETPEKMNELVNLDKTWKLITEGQGKEEKPQLKKSDRFDTRPRTAAVVETGADHGDGEDDPAAWAKRELRKSDTFNDRASLRREKPINRDELNRRVEAFIRKRNNDIRLQRLESDQRC